MEEKGLLERVNTSDDKRYTEIVLTELGEQKMADCHVLGYHLDLLTFLLSAGNSKLKMSYFYW